LLFNRYKGIGDLRKSIGATKGEASYLTGGFLKKNHKWKFMSCRFSEKAIFQAIFGKLSAERTFENNDL